MLLHRLDTAGGFPRCTLCLLAQLLQWSQQKHVARHALQWCLLSGSSSRPHLHEEKGHVPSHLPANAEGHSLEFERAVARWP
ncbi:hypothetical protein Y1Q_0005821 [Alligator mississippiensis]|uniref:Uncharacterized protein n=1 Tax=Alligator mississippiensis TaxID=8496 RepID=A0A151MG16_ALLMI|nr:hypothetical protein Y1Q_0005821 [Alligator mississippiensis]